MYQLSDRASIPEVACVYKITNKKNGMYYVGSTSNLRKRINEHKKPGSKSYLSRAIQCYGPETFSVEIMHDFSEEVNRSVIFECEQRELDSIDDWDKVYNITKKAFTFDYEDPSFKERKARATEHFLKPVCKFSMDGVFMERFNSLKEAEEAGFDHSKVSMTCNRLRKSAYGYQWRFEGDDQDVSSYERKNLPKRVVMIDKKTKEEIATFFSGYMAAKHMMKELGGENTEYRASKIATKIYAVCNGNRKSAHGYVWKRL